VIAVTGTAGGVDLAGPAGEPVGRVMLWVKGERAELQALQRALRAAAMLVETQIGEQADTDVAALRMLAAGVGMAMPSLHWAGAA
jgi:hypothetical protein